MKWKKFLELEEKHPHLIHDLVWRGVMMNTDTKDFVRKKVGFIAFRPIEKLDLSAKHSSLRVPLESQYKYAKVESYVAIEYTINFHVEGESEGSRLRFVHEDVGDGSIKAHIDDINRWFKSCDAFVGKKLVFEYVIKRTVQGSSYIGLSQMNLEIYPFSN